MVVAAACSALASNLCMCCLAAGCRNVEQSSCVGGMRLRAQYCLFDGGGSSRGSRGGAGAAAGILAGSCVSGSSMMFCRSCMQ